jgi:hypothetical protein
VPALRRAMPSNWPHGGQWKRIGMRPTQQDTDRSIGNPFVLPNLIYSEGSGPEMQHFLDVSLTCRRE